MRFTSKNLIPLFSLSILFLRNIAIKLYLSFKIQLVAYWNFSEIYFLRILVVLLRALVSHPKSVGPCNFYCSIVEAIIQSFRKVYLYR